ncbi:hypothetical protein PoB_005459100 [Plakobranchus ocellatus]|uniref:Uncharacterized protein n=1 Tax=Plakobranchus ocellatus TaxID=259542 RepID=A0AAV4C5U7_9GAST|nr:hypothetical protein PoB_005459100 [Plakobranchus ocellatus]
MECDSVLSAVERKLRFCDIFLPQNYLLAIRMARQNPQPYEANEIVWKDAMKLSSDYVKPNRPGKKKDDPSVPDVCSYQYSVGRDGVHKYKLKWSDE